MTSESRLASTRGIAHLAEPLVVEGRRKQVLDQVGHHPAACAVAHHDGRVVLQRTRAGPAKQVEFLFICVHIVM